MKKLWVGMVVCGGLLTGISLTYARIIPGVDEPYNPGAYYSSTAISSADSPSTFFYRDLAGGGNIVYDPERHKNNILSCLKYDEVLKTVQELFKKKKEDATPFGNEGIRAGLQNVQQETISLNLAEEINKGADKVFSNDKMTADEYNQLSRTEQIKYMNDVYSGEQPKEFTEFFRAAGAFGTGHAAFRFRARINASGTSQGGHPSLDAGGISGAEYAIGQFRLHARYGEAL